jgi:DNA-binding NarL/FixJ family response regulator
MRRHILIFGLDESVAADLSRSLVELRHFVVSEPLLPVEESFAAIDQSATDLLFCSADPRVYVRLLDGLRRHGLDLPVVVVSAEPDPESLLDALDAGVRDYCSPPFGPRMLRSIIDNAAGALASVA